MYEKNISFKSLAAAFIICFVCVLGAGYWLGSNGSSQRIAELNRANYRLNREYTDRQRIIETGTIECLIIIERAGEIVERTSANTGTALTNLREASAYIKQGIEEREALKMELHRLRSHLHWIRGMAGLEAGELE